MLPTRSAVEPFLDRTGRGSGSGRQQFSAQLFLRGFIILILECVNLSEIVSLGQNYIIIIIIITIIASIM